VSQSVSNPQEPENQRNFRKLLLSVQSSLKQLNLLIAICDQPTYREELIRDYEAQLTAKGITCLRVQLDRHQTSLKQALLALEAEEPALHEDQPVMVTVCGADQMLSVRLGEAQSAREQFFFSLQWTREALRQFQFPIVIWLTEPMARELTQQAPDFWSWRGGVFQFVRPFERGLREKENAFELQVVPAEQSDVLFPHLHPDQQLRELRQQIADLEAQDPGSPLLASLYSSLGQMYEERLESGLAHSHSREQQLAFQAYKKAIDLQTEKDSVELATDLNNLASLYRAQGRYSEAEPLYLRSLSIYEQQLGQNHPDVATSLSNLANLYQSQGRYSEAEPLYLRSLEIMEQQLGANHPDVANSLNNLANLYQSQGRYSEAEPLYLRSLSIYEEQLGANHPDVATSLNNLAGLYESQGRYSEAEPLYLRSLSIREQQLGQNHPDVATSLNNLANLYKSQGRFSEAEPLYLRSLAIDERCYGKDHPDIATSLNNLALLYQSQGRYSEAEPLYLRSLSIMEQQLGQNHPDVATILNNLASLYRVQGRYSEAEPLYLRALTIRFDRLGETHPNTQTVLNNFLDFLQQVMESGQTGQLSDHPLTQEKIEQLRQDSDHA